MISTTQPKHHTEGQTEDIPEALTCHLMSPPPPPHIKPAGQLNPRPCQL